MKRTFLVSAAVLLLAFFNKATAQQKSRTKTSFNKYWKFILDSANDYSKLSANIGSWRTLNVPHDWSIELPFDSTSPTGNGGGALRGGMGWYSKEFTVPLTDSGKNISIHFDGVYCRSTVWLNGQLLGYRPNGYISFMYNITPFINYGKKNIIVVKVNNNEQSNSRWYSGSGIFRNVWLQKTNKVAVADWGTYITTAPIDKLSTSVTIKTTINGLHNSDALKIKCSIYDVDGKIVASNIGSFIAKTEGYDMADEFNNTIILKNPNLWNIDEPYLYKMVTQIIVAEKITDEYETFFGIRSFKFDADKGFFLNGKSIKINGVCNHHDLGCLGTAFNYRAAERQLEILKAMGCNGIRTSHNPPAPELLDLCDKMGFIVMDEAFDMWKMQKNKYDYHLDFDQWHKKDLEDQVLRDRNHPSVFIWSIGNEIPEQSGSTGVDIANELSGIVRSLDTTRPITAACDWPDPKNNIIKSGALDLIGYNYHQFLYAGFQQLFPGKSFISTESVSALQTRGHYDLFPSDSIRRWPEHWDKPFKKGNPDLTVSAYDNVSAPWGSTHEETWKLIKKYNFLSGQYIWTGFDYIGEPTPYPWPARSSYFGIIDLAGFPKDIYYMYQGEWTNKTVLHIFPHWNWKQNDTVDVWAYYNNADEVELFLNGKSLGIKKKTGDDLHVMWRVQYEPGTLKAISRKAGKTVAATEVKTAGKPAKIILTADRNLIKADGNDLSFITAKITDAEGNMVPDADNLIQFTARGEGAVIATDNGLQTSMESFKTTKHNAFNGLCLAVVQSNEQKGKVVITATAAGLQSMAITIETK